MTVSDPPYSPVKASLSSSAVTGSLNESEGLNTSLFKNTLDFIGTYLLFDVTVYGLQNRILTI